MAKRGRCPGEGTPFPAESEKGSFLRPLVERPLRVSAGLRNPVFIGCCGNLSSREHRASPEGGLFILLLRVGTGGLPGTLLTGFAPGTSLGDGVSCSQAVPERCVLCYGKQKTGLSVCGAGVYLSSVLCRAGWGGHRTLEFRELQG